MVFCALTSAGPPRGELKPEPEGFNPPEWPSRCECIERTCLIAIIALYNYFLRNFGEIVQILQKFMKLKWCGNMTLANNVLKMLPSGQTSTSS